MGLAATLKRVVPEPLLSVARGVLNTLVPSRRIAREQWRRIDRAVAGLDHVVASGPFAGMKLGRANTGSHVPKRLGSYESELHQVIEAIIEQSPRQVIDVGCGEGYYAVGLAQRLPQAQVIGFDISRKALAQCRLAATANGVSDRVELRARCTPGELADLVKATPSFVIVDAEGAEADLLIDPTVSSLRHSVVLVELHEFAAPGITGDLVRRFAPTHTLTTVPQSHRVPDDYPALASLAADDQSRALSESRQPDQEWLVAMPLHGMA